MSTTFILIPGPWMGAWVWEPVARGLRDLGHRVRAITLTGLAGSDDADVSAIGLATHVQDVLATLEAEETREAILVCHSYSGIVAGQVADQAFERVAHTVFVEGFLPHHGRSMLQAFPERQRADEMRLIAGNRGRWPAPDATVVADGQDLTFRQARWLADRFVGHPGRTVAEPAVLTRPLSSLRATYVICEKEHFGGQVSVDVSALRAEPGWTFKTLDTGHWPMVSAPDRLVALLAAVADRV
ncbi:alpha/beta fold hydrolase [Sphaerimonospora sp. CA-214678]|uniref:alpha/beta fold hydrolase n=1 Tax=Sphaerimonospora sp. CA-214678 TaxID=3240029 RepID=UPI003D8BE35B